MKELISQSIGDKGILKVTGGIEGANVKVELSATYPVMAIAEPILEQVDKLIDKLEAIIPGDQKAMADAAKKEYRDAILKLLGNEPTPVA